MPLFIGEVTASCSGGCSWPFLKLKPRAILRASLDLPDQKGGEMRCGTSQAPPTRTDPLRHSPPPSSAETPATLTGSPAAAWRFGPGLTDIPALLGVHHRVSHTHIPEAGRSPESNGTPCPAISSVKEDAEAAALLPRWGGS